MTAQIIDGKVIADKILNQLKPEVEQLKFRPLFCDILVGVDPVSLSFVKIKGRRAEEIGLDFRLVQLAEGIGTKDLIREIEALEQEPNLSGLIVQLPLPNQIDQARILKTIRPEFDADCLSGASKLIPPTAGAIIEILDFLELDLTRQKILIVGHGELVGKPVKKILEDRGHIVQVADRSTNDLFDLTKAADIIISGAGQPNLITGDMIKPGAVLIDAGTAETEGGIVGDIETNSVKTKAAFFSPTPGGVGPVTVAKLLENVVKLAKMRK
jgi:methylenetetrahydrofolate dehydrogenase (NADP+) / methenyltetrahydrofolate cyclohydrolase